MKEYLLKADVLDFLARQFDFYDSKGMWDVADGIEDAKEVLQRFNTYRLQEAIANVQGQWLPNVNRDALTYDNGLMIRYFHCSVCNGDISDRYGKYRYCPHCGARMED